MPKNLRHQYIDALVDAGWWPRPEQDVKQIIDVILAVRDEEMQQLRQQAERARADERERIAGEFRALAARYRAVPDDGLTLGQLHDRDEKAAEYDRIADKIEKGAVNA